MSAMIATTATAKTMNRTNAPPPLPPPKRMSAKPLVSDSVMIEPPRNGSPSGVEVLTRIGAVSCPGLHDETVPRIGEWIGKKSLLTK
jgi:hypothetical protein